MGQTAISPISITKFLKECVNIPRFSILVESTINDKHIIISRKYITITTLVFPGAYAAEGWLWMYVMTSTEIHFVKKLILQFNFKIRQNEFHWLLRFFEAREKS